MSTPYEYYCPITGEIINDPVVDNQGISYERSAIETWLQDHSTSPVTMQPLITTDLRPNIALKNLIIEYISTNTNYQNIAFDPNFDYNPDNYTLNVTGSTFGTHSMIRIIPTNAEVQTPSDICVVIDVSGSMASEALIKGESGENEGYGFSLLDIAKHALLTVLEALGPNDRLSIVTFSSSAKVKCQFIRCIPHGKEYLSELIRSLRTEGQTNLWSGLKTGLDMIRDNSSINRNPAIFLLTDGLPNPYCNRGELFELQQYYERNHKIKVNTFGFGYNLDSQMLHDLSQEHNGTFSFIPDSSMVGTIFVKAMANHLSTSAMNVRLNIQPIDGMEPTISKGYLTDTNMYLPKHEELNNKTVVFDIGSMRFGQSYDIIIASVNILNVVLEYHTPCAILDNTVMISGMDVDFTPFDPMIYFNECRSQFITMMQNAITQLEYSTRRNRTLQTSSSVNLNAMQQFSDDLQYLSSNCAKYFQRLSLTESSVDLDKKFITDFQSDIDGQITEAFSRESWYTRWGIHYIQSIMDAHIQQLCNNFKDVSVQNYGGTITYILSDKIDELFNDLTPPERSAVSCTSRQTDSMQTYNSSSAPCFHGDCTVLTQDGKKYVKHLQKGDRIILNQTDIDQTDNKYNMVNDFDEIECIVRTQIRSKEYKFVELDNGLLITA